MALNSRIRTGLVIGGALTFFCFFGRFVALPVYNSGTAQPILAPVNALSSLVLLPGRMATLRAGLSQNHHDSSLGLVLALGFNFMLYTLLGTLLCPRPRAVPVLAHSNGGQSPSTNAETTLLLQPGHVDRRTFLRIGARNTAIIAAGSTCATALSYSLLLEPKFLPITHRVHLLQNLPEELDGLRVVQLADIHHGQWIPLSFVRRMVKLVNALNPDLILLNGDYVAGHMRYIAPVVEVLGHLRASIGVLGVLGNHDWWEGAAQTRREFQRVGIPLIDNTNRFITAHRTLAATCSRGLCVAGVGDLWEDQVDIGAALKGVPDDMPRLLLSHNPDVAELPEVASGKHRIDLMLSGHTHGGQVKVPFLGTPIVPSDYGQKYAQGLVQGPGCPVYVSRGIGMTVLPLRFGVPPEIAVIELRRTDGVVATPTRKA